MELNPEFRRNIWLQFSWARLLAAPIVIGIVIAAYYDANDADLQGTIQFSFYLFAAIITLWGTRRAAGSLSDEIIKGTWEVQRMSGLTAWSMAWGKLFGGTAFVWYCALLSLGTAAVLKTFVISGQGFLDSPWAFFAWGVLGAILGLAVSLLIALVQLRKAPMRRQISTTFAQFLGILGFVIGLGLALVPYRLAKELDRTSWYSGQYDTTVFHLLSAGIFTIWALIAIWRLMAAELQYRQWPWVWVAFMVFAMGYMAGFATHDEFISTRGLLVAFFVGIVLCYVSFLADAKDIVTHRWALRYLRAGRIPRFMDIAPLWLISCVVTIVVGIAAAAQSQFSSNDTLVWTSLGYIGKISPIEKIGSIPVIIIAFLVFMARDLIFLFWLNLGRWRGRADVTGLIVLWIVYWPVPGMLYVSGAKWALPLFWPFAVGDWWRLDFAALEVLLLILLLGMRWRKTALV